MFSDGIDETFSACQPYQFVKSDQRFRDQLSPWSGSDMAWDPNRPIQVPRAVRCCMGWFGSRVVWNSNGGDRDSPRNVGHFNQLMWPIAQQDFMNFNHCESFKGYVKDVVVLWWVAVVPPLPLTASFAHSRLQCNPRKLTAWLSFVHVKKNILCFTFLVICCLVSDEWQYNNSQRYHYDIYLLCVFRHVQCSQLPITGISLFFSLMWP